MGPAGELLDLCLHSSGIARRECYITNVFDVPVMKKRGQDNKIFDKHGELLWTSTKGFTEAGYDDTLGCRTRLANCNSNVFVPMGGPALSLLTRKSAIVKQRGSILPATPELGLKNNKVIPTIHPAASLRGQYTWRYLIINDLERVKEEREFPEIKLRQRNMIIDPSYDQCMDFLNEVANMPRFATDIEVINRQVSCFSVAVTPDEVITIPMMDRGYVDRWTVEQEAEIWRAYAKIISDPDIAIVNQNLIFDLSFLMQQMGIVPHGRYDDPMLAFSIMYPDFKKGLDIITSIYTKEPYYKDDGKIWRRKAAPNWEQYWEYCAKDSVVAMEGFDNMEADLDNHGYRDTYERTIALLEPFLYMSVRGFNINIERLKAAREDIGNKLKAAEEAFNEHCDHEINWRSSKQVINYFYEHKGIAPYKSYQTGNPTCDDRALARIVRRYNFTEARDLQELRKLDKLNGTYLEVELDKDQRLRCSWNLRGTSSGRVSSSQTVFDTGLNLQNIHPEFRGFIVADD